MQLIKGVTCPGGILAGPPLLSSLKHTDALARSRQAGRCHAATIAGAYDHTVIAPTQELDRPGDARVLVLDAGVVGVRLDVGMRA